MLLANAAAIRIFAIGISYILNITILQISSKETAGQYFLYLSWSSLISVILIGGYSKYIVRELAKESGYENSLRKSSYKYLSIVLLSVIPIIIWTAYQKPELAILVSTIPFIMYLAAESAFLRGKGKHFFGNIEGQIIRPAITIMLIYLCLIFINEINIKKLLAIYAIGIFLCSILWFFLFFPKKTLPIKKSHKFNRNSIINLTTISFAELAFIQLDIILLGFLMSHENIAEYKVALLIRMALLIPQQAVLMVLPYLLAQDTDSPYKYYLRYINLSIGLTGLIVNLLLGEILIGLVFGEEYYHVSGYLNPYFIMMICIGVIGPASEVLIADQKDRIVRKAAIISIVVNSSILILTVPSFGVYAAVFSGALSYVLFYIICYYYIMTTSKRF